MYSRAIKDRLLQGASIYPVVTITGPRQSGKTTLASSVFKNYKYYDLEDPFILEEIKSDPASFINYNSDGVILDEVQNYPEILSYIKAVVDKDRKKHKGQFILTGSQQFSLLNAITQSLAGRTDLLALYPLTFSELRQHNNSYDEADWMVKGFFPEVHQENLPLDIFYTNYVRTYIERDLRKLLLVEDLSLFRNFLCLCAGRVGQLLNIQGICNEIGIGFVTAKKWLSLLETSYVIQILQPYHSNFGKRIVKTPKLYFIDPGLVCHLLKIKTKEHLLAHPLKGQIFENMVVMDIVKSRVNKGLMHDLYFYRDSNQKEIDVLLEVANDLYPLEIKSSHVFNAKFLSSMESFKKMTDKFKHGYLSYCGDPINSKEYITYCNYKNIGEIMANIK